MNTLIHNIPMRPRVDFEPIRWEKAINANSAQAFSDFLHENPDSKHASDAENRLKECLALAIWIWQYNKYKPLMENGADFNLLIFRCGNDIVYCIARWEL